MAVNWYYETEGLQVGPLTEEEFNDLVRLGKIRPDTFVWYEGLATWKRLAELQKSAAPASPLQPEAIATCAECKKPFPPADLIQLQGRWVCGGCKPVAVLRLKEGFYNEQGSANASQLIAEVQRRDYEVRLSENLGRAWNLVKENFWPSVGVAAIVTIIQQAPGIIPFVGPIISLAIMGPLYGGLYYFFLKLVRGQPAEIGDAFKGFGPNWGQLVGAQLIPILIIYACFIPAVIAAVAMGEFSKDAPPIVAIVLALLALPFVIYFSVCWIFSVPLVMDKGLRFWDAMNVSRKAVSMHWGPVFGYLFVTGLLGSLGVLGCCVGVFVTLPVFFCSTSLLYEDIFTGRPALGK